MISKHLSTLDFDALAASIDTPDALGRLRGHVSSCESCRVAFEKLKTQDDLFVSHMLPRHLARMSRPEKTRRWRAIFWWSLAVPTLAGVLMMIPKTEDLETSSRTAPADDPVLGVKGPGILRVIVQRNRVTREVKDGEVLLQGDAIRLVLPPTGFSQVLIVSIDGDGKVSIYYPYAGDRSTSVLPDRPTEAPDGSIGLDMARGPERIYAIWSKTPVLVHEVQPLLQQIFEKGDEAIRKTDRLPLADSFQQSFLIEKAARP